MTDLGAIKRAEYALPISREALAEQEAWERATEPDTRAALAALGGWLDQAIADAQAGAVRALQ